MLNTPHFDNDTVVYMSDRQAADAFARCAATWFKEHPEGETYSHPDYFALLAIRWGDVRQAVKVVKLDSDFQPLIYADMVPDKPRCWYLLDGDVFVCRSAAEAVAVLNTSHTSHLPKSRVVVGIEVKPC